MLETFIFRNVKKHASELISYISYMLSLKGNDVIHLLTKSGNHVLRVDLQKYNGQKAYAKYSKFFIGDESSKYKLTVSGYRGNAG